MMEFTLKGVDVEGYFYDGSILHRFYRTPVGDCSFVSGENS